MADLRKNAFFSQHFRRQYRNVGGNVCVPPQDETLVFCYRNTTDPHFTDRRCHLALSSGLISFIIILISLKMQCLSRWELFDITILAFGIAKKREVIYNDKQSKRQVFFIERHIDQTAKKGRITDYVYTGRYSGS